MKKRSNNWFPSYPGGIFIVPIFLFGILFCLYMIGMSYAQKEYYLVVPWILWILVCIWALCVTSIRGVCYIRVYHTYLVCVYPFRKIRLDYDKCTVGLDYSRMHGCKLWWIYLCYGPSPKFKPNSRNRINAIRCKEGFVRITYRKEVYDELLRVLPKKQATALMTSKRCISDLNDD